MNRRIPVVGVAWFSLMLLHSVEAQHQEKQQPPNQETKQAAAQESSPTKEYGLGESIKVKSGISLVARSLPPEAWLPKLRYRFGEIKGTLLVLSLDFSDHMIPVFEQRNDPEKSDVTLVVGERKINPLTFSTPDSNGSGQDLFANLILARDGGWLYLNSHYPKQPMRILFDVPNELMKEKKKLFLHFDKATPFLISIDK